MNRVIFYENDIYYIPPSFEEKDALSTIDINGVVYYNLLGFIYISTEMENLTHTQIKSINDLRYKYRKNDETFRFNLYIKKLFCDFISALEPNNLLDYGSGFDPIINYCDYNGFFLAFDIDNSSLTKISASINSTNDLSTFPDKCFDLIVSIFVFHFNIKDEDLLMLSKVISNNGLLIVNIHRRNDLSQNNLKKRFAQKGFSISVLEISSRKGHSIWIIYKKRFLNIDTYTKIRTIQSILESTN